MASKYDPLRDYLSNQPWDSVTLSFSDIESMIGTPFPSSARTHRVWWGNQSTLDKRPQAKAWIEGGFKVKSVNEIRGVVTFERLR